MAEEEERGAVRVARRERRGFLGAVAGMVTNLLVKMKPDPGFFYARRGLGICPTVFTGLKIRGAYRKIFMIIHPRSTFTIPVQSLYRT